MSYHKVPGTLQMQAADCGAASLKMLLDDLKFQYTLEEIRNAVCVGRDGASLRDIKFILERQIKHEEEKRSWH